MFQVTNNDQSGSQLVRISQPSNNIIENYCQRVRDDLRSIENSNVSLVLEYNHLFEAKCKLDKEVEIYHERFRQLSLESAKQVEIINRLENIIMGWAPLLPQEEQFKLSTAVYAAKQFEDTAQIQQVGSHQQASACDRRFKPVDEPEEPTNDLTTGSAGNQNSEMSANHQQVALMNLIQILSSQVVRDDDKMNSNTSVTSNVRPKTERKKPIRKQGPAKIKKVHLGDIEASTQTDRAATGATGSQTPQASASQVSANKNLKQTSMYNFLQLYEE